MKLLKYTNILTVALLMATSCSDDYLNMPPVDRLTSDGFYQTPAQSEQGIVGVYADLRYIADYEYLFMSEFRSDNIWINPNTDGFREYCEISAFRAGNDIVTFNNAWNAWYKVIYDANVALRKITDLDFGANEAFKNQLLGEAYFLRGWAYFELARLFGNIPIIDRPVSPNEALAIEQSSARDVYEQIVAPDLLKAKELLPLDKDMQNSAGTKISGGVRADRIAAQAMLGRLYITMAGFPVNDASKASLAKTELKEVIDFSTANGNKYWAPDSLEWQKQWMAENNNKYTIFAIQYRTGGVGNPAIFNMGAGVPPSYTSFPAFTKSVPDICVEKSLVYEFLKVQTTGKMDARGLNQSILMGYDAEPNWPAREPQYDVLYPGSDVNVAINAMFYKFMNTKVRRAALGYTDNIETDMKDGNDWPVNQPVIRLEDVMLMYAELLAKDGSAAEAIAIVNRIRARAGCDAVSAATGDEALAAVKNERRLELMGEGVRWFDLVRWNEWQQAVINMYDRYHNPSGTSKDNVKDGRYLYPIPLNQMNIKPGLYKQNEGY